MEFDTVSASNYPFSDLAKFLNQGFEDYFVPIHFDTIAFLTMVRRDGIDLTSSRVLLADDHPCGIALIARRGWTSRLAAMGIAKSRRGLGAGSWFIREIIEEACRRGEREMWLEVIEQNEAAVRLYQSSGFQTIRRLVGFMGKNATERKRAPLREIDLREMAHLIVRHGFPDLPWQLSGESIAQMNPPARAYRKEQAYVAISDPASEHVAIWSLLVETEARGKGLGTEMLRSLIANHRGKTWYVPAIFPEEFENVFLQAGFEKDKLSQWQMKRTF